MRCAVSSHVQSFHGYLSVQKSFISILGPPGASNMPELYEYLGSLDNGDTELESKGIPPSLYDNDQHRNTQRNVEDTKLAMAEEEIGWYLEEFEKRVEEEVLMIGNISLSEVQVSYGYD